MNTPVNVYSPDYDQQGNPKPSIPDLKDAIQSAKTRMEALEDDAKNQAQATSSFTDDDGNSYSQGARGYKQDAEAAAGTASAFLQRSVLTKAQADAQAAGSSPNLADKLNTSQNRARPTPFPQRDINFWNEENTSIEREDLLNGATENADGTYTLPTGSPGGVIEKEWDDTYPMKTFSLPFSGAPLHMAVVVVDVAKEDPNAYDLSGTLSVEIFEGGGHFGNPGTFNEIADGVYYLQTQSADNGSDTYIRIENVGSDEVKILRPIVYDRPIGEVHTPDDPRVQFGTWDNPLYGPNQRRGIEDSHEDWKHDAYVSKSGSSSNSGGRKSPFRNFADASIGDGESIALLEGKIREEIQDAVEKGTRITGVRENPFEPFPVMTVFEEVSGWSLANNQSNTYKIPFTSEQPIEDGASGGGRGWVYSDDGSGGQSARKVLQVRNSISDVEATPGSVYFEKGVDNTDWTVYIHPFGSTDPSSDAKTYYATSIPGICRLFDLSDRGEGFHLDQVHLRGCVSEDGSVQGGQRWFLDRCILEYGTLHHVVGYGKFHHVLITGESATQNVGNAPVTMSIFDQDPNLDDWEMYGMYIERPGGNTDHILSHNSPGGDNFERIKVLHSHFKGPDGRSGFDGAKALTGLQANNAEIAYNCCKDMFIFKQIYDGWGSGALHHNYTENCRRAYYVNRGYDGDPSIKHNVDFRSNKSIRHQNPNGTSGQLEFARNLCVDPTSSFWTIAKDGNSYIHHNIFVVGPSSSSSIVAAQYNNGSTGDPAANVNADYNIYILVNGHVKYDVTSTNADPRHLSALKSEADEEQNSIELDFRDHPFGLDALFMNIAERDFRIQNTEMGLALKEAMREIERKSGTLPGPDKVPAQKPEFPHGDEAMRRLYAL